MKLLIKIDLFIDIIKIQNLNLRINFNILTENNLFLLLE